MKIPKLSKNKTVKNKKPRKKKSKKNIILIFLISMGIICASAVLAFALYIIVTSPDYASSFNRCFSSNRRFKILST